MKLRPVLVLSFLAAIAAASPSPGPVPLAQSIEPGRNPGDPWGRETPRGAVFGFLDAAREGRWKDAERFLDLSRNPGEAQDGSGQRLARHLAYLLELEEGIDLGAI